MARGDVAFDKAESVQDRRVCSVSDGAAADLPTHSVLAFGAWGQYWASIERPCWSRQQPHVI